MSGKKKTAKRKAATKKSQPTKKTELKSKSKKTSTNSAKKRKKISRKTHIKVKATPQQKEATKKAIEKRKATRPTKDTTPHKRVGRPTTLTGDLIDKITGLIMAGAYIETACAAVGFPKQLYYEWLKLGANRRQLKKNAQEETDKEAQEEIRNKIRMIDPIYEQFNDAINKAVVDAELRDLTRIDAAANKTWQAAAWKLERKHPERWSRHQQFNLSGKVDSEQTVTHKVDPNATRAMIDEIIKDPESLELAEMLIERMKETENGD